ncbi:MAG: oxygen-independent coproporphyrinogen III oxidase [Deltaproteobacteria bacterium]|nr:oxygen-independent coproporphyrinogen III oxidase [Deltaproteobacteria bacterium]
MFQTTINGTAVRFDAALVAKYDRPGPRYTSYPTAPQWHAAIDAAGYAQILAASNAVARPLSLYFHLPFCESHCTFCGCNVIITKQKHVVEPYLADLEREVALVAAQVDRRRAVVQLHWGGGTPTYLSCDQIERVWQAIASHFTIAADAEVGVEVDPRVTTAEQLRVLRRLGFNRVSLGVQDIHPEVQAAVNRLQPLELTAALIRTARALGYASVNTDLIYGLPYQTPDSFQETVAAVLALQPDRVACYNFAYVPWLKAQQRAIDPATLPAAETKLTTWCQTIRQFADADYDLIGFDHFARPDDEMARARRSGTLWRNFQGYTTKAGTDLLAFGITGIGDVDGHYLQNVKKLPEYRRAVQAGTFPLERACHLTRDDLMRRWVIRELLCNERVDANAVRLTWDTNFGDYFAAALAALQEPIADGLATWDGTILAITPLGHLFARNVAMCFDAYLPSEPATVSARYSRTI